MTTVVVLIRVMRRGIQSAYASGRGGKPNDIAEACHPDALVSHRAGPDCRLQGEPMTHEGGRALWDVSATTDIQ